MIYTVAEYAATFIDCILIFAFLIYSIGFKSNITIKIKALLTAIFFIIMLLVINIFNHYNSNEGVLTIVYFIIPFMFSTLVLNGKYWYQLVIILLEFLIIFLVNAVITILSSLTLNIDYEDILNMRNSARIILLLLSKMTTISIFILLARLIKNNKVDLNFRQSIFAIIIFSASIIIGLTIEKMIFTNHILFIYATIIMISVILINILIFLIFSQFAKQNTIELNNTILKTKLAEEEQKLKESIEWSKSVRTLRHDLNNHMIIIKKYIENNENNNALEYINKISKNIRNIPSFANTDNQAFNAIFDLKYMICQKQNIDLKCYIQKNLNNFDDTVFCTVFGNIMDNAIEAEKKEDKKEIKILIKSSEKALYLTVQNKISKSILKNNNLLKTSKDDKINHGLGLYSIKRTIENNKGIMDIFEKDNWFICNIILPI